MAKGISLSVRQYSNRIESTNTSTENEREKLILLFHESYTDAGDTTSSLMPSCIQLVDFLKCLKRDTESTETLLQEAVCSLYIRMLRTAVYIAEGVCNYLAAIKNVRLSYTWYRAAVFEKAQTPCHIRQGISVATIGWQCRQKPTNIQLRNKRASHGQHAMASKEAAAKDKTYLNTAPYKARYGPKR